MIEEKLKFGPRVSRSGAMIFLKLPLPENGQRIGRTSFSAPPTTSPPPGETREYTWRGDEIGDNDSLEVTYLVTTVAKPAWTKTVVDSLRGQSIAWPPVPAGETVEPYILPPLVREDIGRTEFSTLDRADTSVQDIDRLIRRLDRRVSTVRDPENFDESQPLLEDVYRRRTTAIRKHLLLSLALQYLEVPHRVVAGKILSYGEVLENQIWVDIPVAGNWYRVYYGDGVDRSDWLPPDTPDLFLACSYDWRDLTLEVISAPGAPPIPSILFTSAENLLFYFWDRKNTALEKGEYAKAAAMIDSLLQYTPNSVTAITEKGLILTQAGRPQDGLPYFQIGMRKAETPADQSFGMVQLAKFFSLQQNGEEAVKALVRAYQVDPWAQSILYEDPRFNWLTQQRSLMNQLNRALQNMQ
ncbi:MAG: tetratricopeptide repeat protein [Lewinella sp.]